MFSRVRPFATFVKVIVVLAAIDCVVRGPFFDQSIMPYHFTPFAIVRERTGGQAFSILFEGVKRLPRPDVRVAIVGDSTVFASEKVDDLTAPAYFLGRELSRRFPGARIDVVDCSQIGLYAADAALVINRALQLDIDVLVYAVTLRALPSGPVARWTTHISSELGLTDLARLTTAGGGRWLLDTFEAPQLLDGLVYSGWATYAYRAHLKHFVWNQALQPALAHWPRLAEALKPAPLYAKTAVAPPQKRPRGYAWTRDDYGFPNSNSVALEVIGRLCQRYGPGKCFIYAGPVNPLAHDGQVEPGLYEEYMERLRVMVERHGLGWYDYTNAMTPADFVKPKFGQPYDAIHLNVAGASKFADGLASALQDQVAAVLRERHAAP